MIQKIKTEISNGVSALLGNSISGDFEVSPEVLYKMSETMETADNDLNRIIDRTEDIMSDLRYLSVSGFLYKNKLRTSLSSLNSDRNAIMKISKSLCDCAERYDRTDTSVEQLYTNL